MEQKGDTPHNTIHRDTLVCYIAPSMEARPAADDYMARIVKPAREHKFPAW